MRSVIGYMYRDAANRKVRQDAVILDEMSCAQKQEIRSLLIDGEYFVPSMVGLPERRFDTVTEDDHEFFEFVMFGQVDVPSIGMEEVDLTAAELVERFQRAHASSWTCDASEQGIVAGEISKLVDQLIQNLPRTPGEIWTPDGDEILCDTLRRSEGVADLIDALYGGHATTTGFYDEKNDGIRIGYHYIRIDGC